MAKSGRSAGFSGVISRQSEPDSGLFLLGESSVMDGSMVFCCFFQGCRRGYGTRTFTRIIIKSGKYRIAGSFFLKNLHEPDTLRTKATNIFTPPQAISFVCQIAGRSQNFLWKLFSHFLFWGLWARGHHVRFLKNNSRRLLPNHQGHDTGSSVLLGGSGFFIREEVS